MNTQVLVFPLAVEEEWIDVSGTFAEVDECSFVIQVGAAVLNCFQV